MYRQKILDSSSPRKESVAIDTLTIPAINDQKIMQTYQNNSSTTNENEKDESI